MSDIRIVPFDMKYLEDYGITQECSERGVWIIEAEKGKGYD